jgi:hypothetical protein
LHNSYSDDSYSGTAITDTNQETGMGVSLESMAIEMPTVDGHPNRVGFRGVLTFVDVASDKAPAGARGHRVLLTRKAAEQAIPSLLGMGLDYSPRLDCHDTRRKIGVITRAEIVGREISVAGFLYGRDFPEMVAEIGRGERADSAGSRGMRGGTPLPRGQRGMRAGLGMSYEITDALVNDIKAAVWVLNRVTFTGAAVLRRDKAAYGGTWIELG